MARQYTRVEDLIEVIRVQKALGGPDRTISESHSLGKKRVKSFINWQNCKERMLMVGCIPCPKKRLRKEGANEEFKPHNELVRLRIQVERLRILCSKLEEGETEFFGSLNASVEIQC